MEKVFGTKTVAILGVIICLPVSRVVYFIYKAWWDWFRIGAKHDGEEVLSQCTCNS